MKSAELEELSLSKLFTLPFFKLSKNNMSGIPLIEGNAEMGLKLVNLSQL